MPPSEGRPTKGRPTKGRPGKAPAYLLDAAQFAAAMARAGRTSQQVRAALWAHLVNGEPLATVAERWQVDRSNLYAKLDRMRLR